MLLGLLSDTHGNAVGTEAALQALRDRGVDCIVHCGDIDEPGLVALFQPTPTHFVLGNMDQSHLLPTIIRKYGHACYGRFGSLELGGRRIAFLHGHERRVLEQAVGDGQWDLVCHGHTHTPTVHRVGRTLVVNPGAVHRSSEPSVAVVDLESLEVTHIPIYGPRPASSDPHDARPHVDDTDD